MFDKQPTVAAWRALNESLARDLAAERGLIQPVRVIYDEPDREKLAGGRRLMRVIQWQHS